MSGPNVKPMPNAAGIRAMPCFALFFGGVAVGDDGLGRADGGRRRCRRGTQRDTKISSRATRRSSIVSAMPKRT